MKSLKRKPGRYPYPFLECDHHPGRQRAYCACVHLAELPRPPVGKVELATDDSIGLLLCVACCNRNDPPDVNNFKAICEGCAIERGLLITQ